MPIDPQAPFPTDPQAKDADKFAELFRRVAALERRQFNPTDWGLVEPVQHVIGNPGEPGYFFNWGATTVPGVSFSKDAFGNVQLTGRLRRFSGAASTAFMLPAGFRPATLGAFPVFSQSVPAGSGSGLTIVNVLATGEVNPAIAPDQECWLHPVSFRAAPS